MSTKDSGSALASQEDVTKVVRDIVSESDLNRVTEKDVRLAVVKQLGARLGDDAKRVKTFVKHALNVVLEDPASQATSAAKHPKTEPATVVEPVLKAVKAKPFANVEPAAPEPKSEPWASVGIAAEEHAASDANSDPPPRPVKRARKRIDYQDDSSDEDGDADGEIADDRKTDDRTADDRKADAADTVKNDTDAAPVTKRKTKKKEDSDEDYANGDGGNSDVDSDGEVKKLEPTTKRKRKRTARSSTEKPARATSVERQLQRYMKVARQIGWPVPPTHLKNKSPSEKRAAVVAFLNGKGFNVLDSSNMNKAAIDEFRKKVDQEKELAELDASNIIENDGGRPRRRRSATRNPVSYVEPKINDDEDADSEEMPTPEESEKEEESEGYVGSGGSDDDD